MQMNTKMCFTLNRWRPKSSGHTGRCSCTIWEISLCAEDISQEVPWPPIERSISPSRSTTGTQCLQEIKTNCELSNECTAILHELCTLTPFSNAICHLSCMMANSHSFRSFVVNASGNCHKIRQGHANTNLYCAY